MQPVDYFGTLETEDECRVYVFAQLYTDIKIPDFPACLLFAIPRGADRLMWPLIM